MEIKLGFDENNHFNSNSHNQHNSLSPPKIKPLNLLKLRNNNNWIDQKNQYAVRYVSTGNSEKEILYKTVKGIMRNSKTCKNNNIEVFNFKFDNHNGSSKFNNLLDKKNNQKFNKLSNLMLSTLTSKNSVNRENDVLKNKIKVTQWTKNNYATDKKHLKLNNVHNISNNANPNIENMKLKFNLLKNTNNFGNVNHSIINNKHNEKISPSTNNLLNNNKNYNNINGFNQFNPKIVDKLENLNYYNANVVSEINRTPEKDLTFYENEKNEDLIISDIDRKNLDSNNKYDIINSEKTMSPNSGLRIPKNFLKFNSALFSDNAANNMINRNHRNQLNGNFN